MGKILCEEENFKVEGHLHADFNCSRIKIIGHITGNELLNKALPKINEFFEASIENHLRDRIVDFSEVILDASYEHMKMLGQRNQYLYEKYPDAKVVIIADEDLTFGEFRIYDALHTINDENIRTVVRTFTEAQKWLTRQSR